MTHEGVELQYDWKWKIYDIRLYDLEGFQSLLISWFWEVNGIKMWTLVHRAWRTYLKMDASETNVLKEFKSFFKILNLVSNNMFLKDFATARVETKGLVS